MASYSTGPLYTARSRQITADTLVATPGGTARGDGYGVKKEGFLRKGRHVLTGVFVLMIWSVIFFGIHGVFVRVMHESLPRVQ